MGIYRKGRQQGMFKCKECGCNCDNADIINGICDDCREEIERQEKKRSMFAFEGDQIEFGFCATHNIHRQDKNKTLYII